MYKYYYVYILTNARNKRFYVGITNEIARRTWEHKYYWINSYCRRLRINKLVYYEVYEDVLVAINREKRLKRWYRRWKIELINSFNPEWKDLYQVVV